MEECKNEMMENMKKIKTKKQLGQTPLNLKALTLCMVFDMNVLRICFRRISVDRSQIFLRTYRFSFV